MEKIIEYVKKGFGFLFAFFTGVLAVILGAGLRNNGNRTESTGEQLNEVAGGLAEVRGDLAEARGTVEESLGIIEKVRARKRIDN